MTELTHRKGVPQYTLAHYEEDYADRHLLHGCVAKWAKEIPNKVAIIDAEKDIEYTYQQFDQISTALAFKLLKLGFRKGDFLATSLPFLTEHVFLEYACFKIGVIHAPLDLRLKAPEVIRSLGLIQAKGFAFLGKTAFADFTPLGQAIKDNCDFVEIFIQFTPPDETVDYAYSAVTMAEEARQEATAIMADPGASEIFQLYREAAASIKETDGCQVIYTTGSTGFPKPALLSHRNITSQNMGLGGAFGILDNSKMLVNLPPSHVGGQAEQLMTPFFWGGTAVLLYIFDPAKTLTAIQTYNIDSFGQIPALFAMEWKLPNYKDFDLSSLRFALYGGQQVTRQFLEQLSAMAPKFGTGLGLTEMGGFVTYSPLDGTVDDILASVGFDMPVTPLTIREPIKEDGTAGDELPDGEAGEICFSGPQVFIAYVNNEEAYRATVSTEGVCYTGDLGFKDETGLHFSGRAKLVIKPKGYQVHPAQIEEHFAALEEKVASTAAVGAQHDLFTEGVVLFVEKKPGVELTVEELVAHAKEVAGYMRPSLYLILEPGQMPLNRVAKTDYVELKSQANTAVEQARAAGGWDRG
ncbi:MAG: class I adenylate-forming enzyme family protein [Candidatus Lernaella stagnicola]|nr:class I adenylate-forming enzyme family protein [Candidatus Lernaella stagnicola]